jgi:hypothetical protein
MFNNEKNPEEAYSSGQLSQFTGNIDTSNAKENLAPPRLWRRWIQSYTHQGDEHLGGAPVALMTIGQNL